MERFSNGLTVSLKTQFSIIDSNNNINRSVTSIREQTELCTTLNTDWLSEYNVWCYTECRLCFYFDHVWIMPIN